MLGQTYQNTGRHLRGVTLIELLVSIAIFAAIATFSTYIYLSYYINKTLDATAESVHAAFSRAFLDTIGSKNDAQYGVHVAMNGVTVFTGTTYNPAATDNVSYPVSQGVQIATISLNGGVSDVVYQRVTGATDQYGTFLVRSTRDASKYRTVTVHQVGMISVN